jgi:hypothetical protein
MHSTYAVHLIPLAFLSGDPQCQNVSKRHFFFKNRHPTLRSKHSMNRASYPHGGKSPCILNVGVRRCYTLTRIWKHFGTLGEGRASVVRGAEIPCCSLVTCYPSGHSARFKWTNRAYSREQRVGRARAECLKDVQQDRTSRNAGAVPSLHDECTDICPPLVCRPPRTFRL